MRQVDTRVMFEPIRPTHDDAIARVVEAVAALSPRQVADGFLASLSTRRLEWRSALGSHAAMRHMPVHGTREPLRCRTCGLYEYVHFQQHDLNVLNAERFKWGGVRHTDPIFAALDLELFRADPPPAPTAADIAIFRELIAAISEAPASVTSSQLHKHFPVSLKANKGQRDIIIGILGLCGILATPEHPGFFDRFIAASDRSLPNRHFVDMAYPACWWRGSDGLNEVRLQELFGHVL